MVVMRGRRLSNNLYTMIGEVVEEDRQQADSVREGEAYQSMLWHSRLGHLHDQGIHELEKTGKIPTLKKGVGAVCESCVMAKQHKVTFERTESRSNGILDLIHSDVWGPAPTRSRGGTYYFVTFIDDYSRKTWVFLMESAHKSQPYVQSLEASGGEADRKEGEMLEV